MNTYLVTIAITSDNKTDRILNSVERMTRDWFGSTAIVDSIAIEDPDEDPDFAVDPRTVDEQATDDHNEGVTYSLGWKRYTRTDGTVWTNPDLEED